MRGLLKRSGKRTVCGMVSSRNQKPPSWEKARVATALYHAEAFVCLPKSVPSRSIRARVIGEELHCVVKCVDDFQNGPGLSPSRYSRVFSKSPLAAWREDEVAHDADRIFCLSSSKNALPSLT